MQNIKTIFVLAIMGTIVLFACKKDDPDPAAQKYYPQVKKIMEANCYSCHLSTGAWSGRPTMFDTDAQITAAYASIKASLVDPVTYTNKRMPQDTTLSESDINIVVEWYKKGGKSTD